MGIPHYYKHILSTHKSIIKNIIPKCDRYYIDFNSIIHQCATAVVSSNPAYTFNDIIDNVILQTVSIIKAANPSEFVFIGIDGVAPRAKMAQQRKRRYITCFKNEVIRTTYEKHMFCVPCDWDSNAITPGTPFMNELDKRMTDYFNTNEFPFKVFVSDSSQPDEGEQKLFDHMRSYDDDKINVINGLDADLIMLSLLSKKTIYLQRDDKTYIDIVEFRKSIAQYVSPEYPTEQLMWDYVFLCVLLGNDFIPNIPFLKIINGGIDILLNIYKHTTNNLREPLVIYKNNEFTINANMLTEIIRKCSEMERGNLEYAIKSYTHTEIPNNLSANIHIPNDSPKYIKKFLIELEHYPLKHRHPLTCINDFSVVWNLHYYQDFFGSYDVKMIKKYSCHYLDGLYWVFNYYFNQKYDKFWYYRYPVSPLCTDLYKTLLGIAIDDSSLQRLHKLQRDSYDMPITSEIQLLCVIPAKSINILPKHLQRIVQEPQYSCLDYYPVDFELCTFLKRFLWECTPILPDIDIKRICKAIQTLHEQVH